MMLPLRNLLVLLVAICLAIPTICDEGGGENNGGTGVWILPACANISASGVGGATSRNSWTVAGTAADVNLVVSAGMGAPSAMFVDDISGLPIALDTSGRTVTISKSLLQVLHQSSMRAATVIITDTAQRGYILRVEILLDGKVKISVR